MSRFVSLLLSGILSLAPAVGFAAASPAPAPIAAPAGSPAASPSPPAAASPNATEIINSMAPADLQQAIQLLKSNYINPEALSEAELNRAMLSGVLMRIGRGALMLPERPSDGADANSPLFAEVIDEHIGYLRLGALTTANLQALDTNLQKFVVKKVDAIVLDLRASQAPNDFAIAAEVASRFSAKGKPLFSLRKAAGRQERTFASEREPTYQGLIIVLTDGETSGPAEAIAGVLRLYNKALLIGQPTAGRAVEYSDLPLNNGRLLRVAVAEALLPEGRPLFPGGLKPDIAVEMPVADKRLIFEQSVQQGMSSFVFESERPHLNEAALLAGRNPEIEATEAARRNRNNDRPQPRDPVVQRAVDVVTSLSIYQQR